MKENVKRIINLIILIAIAIVTFIAVKSIPNFLIKTSILDKTGSTEILEMAPGAVFELNESNTHQEGDVWKVTVPGISQIYCAEKGAHFSRHGYTYEEIVAYVNQYNGKSQDGTCIKPEEKISRPYYKIDSQREATPEEAYIVTYPVGGDYNGWSIAKQHAVWGSTLSHNKTTPGQSGESMKIIDEAKNYDDFAKNEQSKMSGASGSGDGVLVSVRQSSYEYIVGPFPGLNYGNGDYGDITFGGISEMYVQAESGQLEIKSFIIDGAEVTPQYFTPDGVEYVDRNKQQYPKPGQEFYVKVVSDKEEQINNIHTKFKWMEAEAEVTYYKASKYKSVFTCKHTQHCHGHVGSHSDSCAEDCTDSHNFNCGSCCFMCTVTGKVEEFNPEYQDMLSAEGTRKLHECSIDIPVPQHREPTPEPPSKNLQIKLAGRVWVDEDASKQSEPNGIKDGEEKVMPGVEVILHEQGGAEVARTVSDNNGYYEFNDLNAQKKYYVEFVYDGQTYQATKYNTSLSDEARLAGWINNATEDPNERTNFNNNFAEIGSAPGNYTVRRSLYYGVGSKNTAWILEKESSETPYGIKEVYDYLIKQAVETKSYSSAYASALSHFGNNNTTKSKLQFIEDSRISSYTGYNGSRVNYPIWDNFNESAESRTVAGVFYPALYPSHLQIDFGLNPREKFDFALRKDVEKATIEINGKVHTYDYDTRSGDDEKNEGTWDISVRLSDKYYDTKYSREVFASDYRYDVEDYYGPDYNYYGKSKSDELEIYVTYKLTVRNQSQSILGEIRELVDYYDKDYTYEDSRSYIEIKVGNNKGKRAVGATATSRYPSDTTNIDGYNALYVQGLDGIKLTSGQTAYIYLTFRVNKDGEGRVLLDENNWRWENGQLVCTPDGVGKENIAEINGFKTYYRDGTQIPNIGTKGSKDSAGLFDRDSVPGNINPNDVPKDGNINYKNFEDDSDKAPNIRLILYKDKNGLFTRKADGIIWEDIRDEINKNQVTAVGDGIYDKSEPTINGVTIQLVELMDNGTEYVWQEISSGQGNYKPIININDVIKDINDNATGKYIFNSYPTGNFIVRFKYGDKPATTLTVENGGANKTSYNGQDYKSTTYQEGIKQDKVYTWREDSTWNLGQETLGEILTQIQTFKPDCSNNETANALLNANAQTGYLYDITESARITNVSDAKDIASRRNQVIDYSDDNVTNYIAEVLRSHDAGYITMNERDALLRELMEKTQMTAETGVIVIEVEYDRQSIDTKNDEEASIQGKYDITNLNLGLEERPKAQLSINKEVTNVKLTLADGSTLFDATNKMENVLWRKHKAYKFNYNSNKLVSDPMAEIREKNTYDAQYGLVQLSMDEELMHGATIKISYKVTVTNKGEVDYKDNKFYYTGTVKEGVMPVSTIANKVIDYVGNNLQFYAVDNSAWEVISKDVLYKQDNRLNLVNAKLGEEIEKYNTIIQTKEAQTKQSNISQTQLLPEVYCEKYNLDASSVNDDLVLTQLITSENETDDLTYRNVVEIVKTSNDVGRRMAYSVVGNQNPNKDADITEVDSDRAEIVKILPPYGTTAMPYIIATITLLTSAILVIGIIFIKKKVQK